VRKPIGTLALAAAVGAAAASIVSLALFAVAIGLVLLTAGGALAVALAASRVTVRRRLSTREAHESAPIHLRFTVEGMRWLPVRIEVEDHHGGWVAVAGAEATLEFSVSRRGAYWLAPSRLRVCDAVGIFEWRLLAGTAEPLLILPAPDGSAHIHPGPSTMTDDPELHGLAPYAEGTPFARIHWPAFARGAGLHVRHFGPSRGGLPLVVVDTVDAPSGQALDWAARVAAGYILALARNGGCRVLLPGDSRETNVTGVAGDWRAVHRRLAMLQHSATSGAAPHEMGGLHVRAATAPAGLTAGPPLPAGVLPRRL
jgi:uncharacterized protein (DUF58 family)